ncbi:LPXTG cell wall anchor domain-containing protein [Streptococcus dysgalactiae]|uniref:LPXTG cell wall anchor domain-containing protein n=1 Tax=Streptococcus dysgalactiae TaxID=1334 RepID=UPI0004257B1E|nr:LPXTG cell wall anchor domain-containing protein [Streptococcus dysgalactiae]MDY2963716.1 LPXTG cell wall anchor domain-containing protein [Streptococcus dysgalactiae]NQK09054.1 LPXTG cell wall anchor domain-containing protein [Streptococcus suis]NQK21368.1 LPXTG cell wall anchor domain-containing protein [Streptococcus suis]
MKKWTKMMTLYSVAVLASASSLTAFADENVPVTTDTPAVAVESTLGNSETTPTTPSDDTTVPTVPTNPVETPTVPTDTTGGDVVTPTDPNVTVPTEPSTTEPTDTTTVTQPSDTTVPPTDGTTEPTKPSTTTEPSEPAQPTEPTTTTEPSSDGDGTVIVPTVNGGTTTLTPNPSVPTNNPAVSAQTAVNAGASQVGTTSTVTGQVVSNVTPSAPVYTNTGYQIVSTQNSQVVVAYNDGTTATVAPEVVGGVVNADKTISVKTNTGETKTLPTTGEKENAMLTISGIITMLGAFLFKKKMVKDN